MENLEQAKAESSLKDGINYAQVLDDDNQDVGTKFDKSAEPTNKEVTSNFASEKYGKFKDAESLLKAYNSLQAEFTKKSQRISELESLYEPITKSEKINAIVDEWITKYSILEPFREKLKENLSVLDGDLEKLAEQNVINMLADKICVPEDLVKNKEFLSNYIFNNEEVKNVILNEYIDKLNSAPKVKVATNFNSSIPLTPPQSLKTIEEAGNIAKTIIKKQ